LATIKRVPLGILFRHRFVLNIELDLDISAGSYRLPCYPLFSNQSKNENKPNWKNK